MNSRSKNQFTEEIISELKTKIIGKKIYQFETIDSTNLFAKKLIRDGIGEGAVVVADVQLRGRGRKNRTWSSPIGGLWFSVILYPNITPEKGMMVTMSASIAVSQAIKEVTNLNSEIKWPNDILIDGKKVCGIITEIDTDSDKINYMLVGIGINVNNEIEDTLQNIAISLKQKSYKNISKAKLLHSILKFFNDNYIKMNSGNFELNRNLWLSFSNIIGKKIRVKDGDEEIEGIVKDIDESGYLILETSKGITRIICGDIEYL
jgi:BirA family biotin operon repressor/biotin-[acetyl-CoA-carboxylase] ligase